MSISTLCVGVCFLAGLVDFEVVFEMSLVVVARWMGCGPGVDGLGGRPSTLIIL